MVGQQILILPVGVRVPVPQCLDSFALLTRSALRPGFLEYHEINTGTPSDGERGLRPSRTGVEE